MDPAPPQPETNAATQEDAAATAEATTDLALYCPSCMYDLRGLTGAACPECGCELASLKQTGSSIPWALRRWYSQPIKLLATARRTLLHLPVFASEMARPADLRAALAFRRAVVGWVWLMLAVSLWVGVWGFEQGVFESYELDDIGWVNLIDEFFDDNPQAKKRFNWLFPVLAGVLLWVYLYLATGVHTYWMHPSKLPSELRGRALTLSYYACAPLVLLFIPLALIVGSVFMLALLNGQDNDVRLPFVGTLLTGVLLYVACIGLWLLTCVRFAGRLAHRGLGQQLLMAAMLPLAWLAIAAGVFVIVPTAVVFVHVVFSTI